MSRRLEAVRMIRDLRADGLFDNEIADFIKANPVTMWWWLNRTTEPSEHVFARLVAFHKKRGLTPVGRKLAA